MPRRMLVGIVVFGAILLVFLAAPALIRLAADWYWFQAVGFQAVFTKTLAAKLVMGLGVGLAAFLFLYFNLRFAQRGVSMTKFESRPSRVALWDYLFFVDIEGHRADANVTAALEEVGRIAGFLKVLGSYPAAVL